MTSRSTRNPRTACPSLPDEGLRGASAWRGGGNGVGTVLAGVLLAGSVAANPMGSTPVAASGMASVLAPLVQNLDDELEALLAEERAAADRNRRRGETRRARGIYEEHLDDEPGDVASRVGFARCLLDECRYEEARKEALRAYEDAALLQGPGASDLRAEAARVLGEVLLVRGESGELVSLLGGADSALRPAHDARDAWVLGRALVDSGDRNGGREVLRKGANTDMDAPWDGLLAKAYCERRLGWLARASQSVVAADDASKAVDGEEASVLVALAEVYFEADGEIDHQESKGRSPGVLLKDALELNPTHEEGLLALFRLHDHNWRRQSRSPHEILEELFAERPDSINGLLAAAREDLHDGQLKSARERLERLGELAPKRREFAILQASLAWIEHRREEAEEGLAALLATHPWDGVPEREVGTTLNELYRFAEARPFLERSVSRNDQDHLAWTQLGRAQANTGNEKDARESLEKAIEVAEGRQNAWRHNMQMVLDRMDTSYVVRSEGDLAFAWMPDAEAVLKTYLVPFYEDSRVELAERYGFTPDPVRIEVFRRFQDFSVRSTGFEGFPALGVCFGPVVTAVSPLSELRGQFSWARTSYHEFTHVIHLGLSHNRCPRWITEGLATWEEEQKNPSWTRNMTRDLLDAYANDDLIKLRDLNRAFRGPRIIFGYYQGGLLCEMLVDQYGFPAMVRFLEAFDRGLDLDQACAEVFAKTPEEIDVLFGTFVEGKLEPFSLEPRWQPRTIARMRLRLPKTPPEGEEAKADWASQWESVAWGAWQQGKTVDAEQALRVLGSAGLEGPRSTFLRAEIALSGGDQGRAEELYQEAIDEGGEDFRTRLTLGRFAVQEEDYDLALEHFEAAEICFAGFPENEHSAELLQSQIYGQLGETDRMMEARERWLFYNPGNYDTRMAVADWHQAAGRHARAAEIFEEANHVDPFRRKLHIEWGRALLNSDQAEPAIREFQIARRIQPSMDLDQPGPLGPTDEARLLGLEAQALMALEREDEALTLADRATDLDPACPEAQVVQKYYRSR